MQLPTDSGSNAARTGLFIALGLITIAFLVAFVRAIRQRAEAGEDVRPRAPIGIISFIANFLDTLGIGSFATTTSMVRQWKLVPDEKLPGTLNIGYVLPTVAQAFLFTNSVPVHSTTLLLMIAAAVVGAWLGAPIVASWPRRRIQIGLGSALLIFATIMALSQPQIGLLPTGGNALSLGGAKLALGLAGNFMLGALMTLGIGLYAPCMILIYLLGMTPAAAFPIMMGSCAFLMPVASVRFFKVPTCYDAKAVVGMAVAAVPAVFVAWKFFNGLNMTAVKWLVVVVVTYAAVSLLRAARREADLASKATAAEAAIAS